MERSFSTDITLGPDGRRTETTATVAPAAGSYIGSLPESFDGGVTLYDKRNTVKRFTIDDTGAEIVVKRFRLPRLPQIIGQLFRGSKARRAFRNALELKARGLATPDPIGYVELRRAPLVAGHCYLITAPCDDEPIRSRLEIPDRFDTKLAEAFGRYVAGLHRAGVIHRDLNSTNVLFAPIKDGEFRFTLIDINRMDFKEHGKQPPLSECMENLTRFTGRLDVTECVARAYATERGLDPEHFASQMLAVKRRHDRLWRLRKRICHPFRKH